MKDLTFYQKISKIQAEISVDKVKRQGQAVSYAYRNIEDIIKAVKPYLDKYELFITFQEENKVIKDEEGEKYRIYIESTAKITDGDKTIENRSRAREATAKFSKSGSELMDRSQVTGSSISYARKYALCGLLLISPAPDSDDIENELAKIAKASNKSELNDIASELKNKKFNPKDKSVLTNVYKEKIKSFEQD